MEHLFDSHAHYDDSQFSEDREKLFAMMPTRGVGAVLNPGCDLASSREAISYAEQYPYVYAAVGVHPQNASSAQEDDFETLRALANHPKVVAIGEIGLDYHYDDSPRPVQQKVFTQQLILARELSLPVILHDREAHGDMMDALRQFRPKGILHCFSGSAEMAKEVVRLGMYVGFTGVITFKNAVKAVEAAKAVPLERLLIETDCPYMAPEPMRGKRNDSSLLKYIAQRLAEIKGVDVQTLCDITYHNACEVYSIPCGIKIKREAKLV